MICLATPFYDGTKLHSFGATLRNYRCIHKGISVLTHATPASCSQLRDC